MFSRLWERVAAKSKSHRKASRGSLIGVLQHAKTLGLSPKTVIDVGAAYGEFALRCRRVFPDAKYVLLEPLQEYKPFLNTVLKTLPGEHIEAAAAAKKGEIMINVHRDLLGSSLYLEDEDSDVNGFIRTVPVVTLDGLIEERELQPPYLMKLDVQGAELDVLSGAEEALRNTDYIVMEASFFQFFKAGPQLHDVITFMKSRGFVAYDICGMRYRPLDNALSQADLAFVKERASFRERHYWATRYQREEQDRRLQSLVGKLAKRSQLHE